jgi:hypothetical protein
MENRWNEIDRGKPKYSGEKPVPVPLCPSQIPHGLTRDRTRASAVGGRRLTASAMARPISDYLEKPLSFTFKDTSVDGGSQVSSKRWCQLTADHGFTLSRLLQSTWRKPFLTRHYAWFRLNFIHSWVILNMAIRNAAQKIQIFWQISADVSTESFETAISGLRIKISEDTDHSGPDIQQFLRQHCTIKVMGSFFNVGVICTPYTACHTRKYPCPGFSSSKHSHVIR